MVRDGGEYWRGYLPPTQQMNFQDIGKACGALLIIPLSLPAAMGMFAGASPFRSLCMYEIISADESVIFCCNEI